MRTDARIVIAGGPKVGKTTRAKVLGTELRLPTRSTDDLIGTHSWSEASDEVARWFDLPGGWIIEGVAAVRALRKWLASGRTGTPADILYWGTTPQVVLNPGQIAMAKGVETVWHEVRDELARRGLRIEAL